MKLTITGCAGRSTDQGASVTFQPPGGTIGRSSGCNLPLVDPEHHIAQVQALLNHRQDGWYLLNTGPGTPIEVDGLRLELNQECRLQGGEQLEIGPYLLRSETDHNAPLVETAGTERTCTSPSSPDATATPTEPGKPHAAADPAAIAPPSATLSTPLTHVQLVEPGITSSTQAWVSPSYFGHMPESDFFQSGPRGAAPPPDDSMGNIQNAISLDPLALFDQGRQSSDLLDNLGPSLLNASLQAAHSPMLDGHRQALSQTTVSDQVDIGRATLPLKPPSFRQNLQDYATAAILENQDLLAQIGIQGSLTTSIPSSLAPAPKFEALATELERDTPQDDTTAPPHTFALTRSTDRATSTRWPDAVVEEPVIGGEEHSQPRNAPKTPLPPPAEEKPVSSMAGARTAHLAHTSPTTENQEPSTTCPAVRHFMAAAGIAQVQPTPLPLEQRMAQLGRLFRLFADGTVQLLASRTLLKHEVRAELTRVMDFDNNPFKILPSGEAVLIQMFGQPLPGFLCAEAAISDALEDLQHHQLGVLAGTRTALFQLIHELDPQLSENATPPRGILDRLFPRRVERRRWGHYRQRYRALLALAQSEDFYRLFGDTFRQAYEEEVCRYSAVSVGLPAEGSA